MTRRARIKARKDRYVDNLIAARMFVWSRCYQTRFFLKLAWRALRGEIVGGYEYEDVARDSGTVLRKRFYFSVESDTETDKPCQAWLISTPDDFCDCGNACGWVQPYGFVPEAGCSVHDADDETEEPPQIYTWKRSDDG